MKRILLLVWTCILLFSAVSCADGGMMGSAVPEQKKTAAEEETEPDILQQMNDLMQFHVTAIDPALEGKGYWQYSEDYRTYRYHGYWVPNEGEQPVAENKVFVEKRLEPGVPLTVMLGLGHRDGVLWYSKNIKLHIQFDGVVKVTKVEPADNSILLAFNLNDQWNGLTTIEKLGPTNLNILPVGKELSLEGVGGPLISPAVIAGKEYTVEVKGYELDGTLLVTAQLKIITLPDKGFDGAAYVEKSYFGYSERYSYGEELTRLCSIELVSYEFSDIYKMMAGQ